MRIDTTLQDLLGSNSGSPSSQHAAPERRCFRIYGSTRGPQGPESGLVFRPVGDVRSDGASGDISLTKSIVAISEAVA